MVQSSNSKKKKIIVPFVYIFKYIKFDEILCHFEEFAFGSRVTVSIFILAYKISSPRYHHEDINILLVFFFFLIWPRFIGFIQMHSLRSFPMGYDAWCIIIYFQAHDNKWHKQSKGIIYLLLFWLNNLLLLLLRN